MKLVVMIPKPELNQGELKRNPGVLIVSDDFLLNGETYYKTISPSGGEETLCPGRCDVFQFDAQSVFDSILNELWSQT